MIKNISILALIALFIAGLVVGGPPVLDTVVKENFGMMLWMTFLLTLVVLYVLPIFYATFYIFTSYIAYAEGESIWWQPIVLWVPIIGPLLYWLVILLRQNSGRVQKRRKTNLIVFFIVLIFASQPGIATAYLLAQKYGPYTKFFSEHPPKAPKIRPKL